MLPMGKLTYQKQNSIKEKLVANASSFSRVLGSSKTNNHCRHRIMTDEQ